MKIQKMIDGVMVDFDEMDREAQVEWFGEPFTRKIEKLKAKLKEEARGLDVIEVRYPSDSQTTKRKTNLGE